jgi:type II secretory pathway pseudopilin PulG
MIQVSPKRRTRSGEDGYILVAVIFMMAILILSLAVAVPKVRESIQRDRDEETMQRGKQYIRAIQLYYRKFHAYPPNVDALVKTNEIRFLRKKYIDPTTGKEEWKPVMWGQNKTPCAMGFFGQPLPAIGAGGCSGGIGPSGNNLNGPGSSTPNGSIFSSTPGTATPTTGTSTTGTTTTDQSGNGTVPGASGTPNAGGPAGQPGTTPGSPAGSNPIGSGQTFGGAGIIGFSPQSPKQSILVYKKKNHYIDWEFLYSPLMDQQQMTSGTGLTGQPGAPTTPLAPIPSPTSPTTPANPTTPTTPQQQ